MDRAKSMRTAAKVLHETLRNLEQSPDVDPIEPPFLKLKSSVLEKEVKLQEEAAAIETPLPEEDSN